MKCPSGDQKGGEKAPPAICLRSEPSALRVNNCACSVVTASFLPSGDHEANQTLKPLVSFFLSVPSTRMMYRSRRRSVPLGLSSSSLAKENRSAGAGAGAGAGGGGGVC